MTTLLIINLPEIIFINNETLKEVNADIFSLSLMQKPQKGWIFLSEVLSRNFRSIKNSKFRLFQQGVIIEKRIDGKFGEDLYRTFRIINLFDLFRSNKTIIVKFLRPFIFFVVVYLFSRCEVNVTIESNLALVSLIIVLLFAYNLIGALRLNKKVNIYLNKF